MKRLREKHRIAIYRILAGHPYDRVARFIIASRVPKSHCMDDSEREGAFNYRKRFFIFFVADCNGNMLKYIHILCVHLVRNNTQNKGAER
jgi:hypothetical protein